MLITFEGGEGSGKTVQSRHIFEYLKDRGYDCILTREPGGTEMGRHIRNILLDKDIAGLSRTTEFLLYLADRAQHLKEIILPSLAEGRIVLCDRFFDSTFAYQGYGRGIDVRFIQTMHELLFDDILPILTLYLDIDPEIGVRRATDQNRFERDVMEFHRRVRTGFLVRSGLEPTRFKVIDASRSEMEVMRTIMKRIREVL